MSETSDQVWKAMQGELRRVRRRRVLVRSGVITGIGLLALVGAMKFPGPAVDPGEEWAGVPEEAEVALPEVEPQRLAVLVYDGVGMRFELMGADQLASSEMEFSLQPVVRNTGAGDFW